jgi:GTP-binding protein
MDNRSVRLYYVTQVSAAPPTFVIASNYPERVHFSYRRYVINQLRERFGFTGTPVRVMYRGRDKRR